MFALCRRYFNVKKMIVEWQCFLISVSLVALIENNTEKRTS